jgi:hypothetical protein
MQGANSDAGFCFGSGFMGGVGAAIRPAQPVAFHDQCAMTCHKARSSRSELEYSQCRRGLSAAADIPAYRPFKTRDSHQTQTAAQRNEKAASSDRVMLQCTIIAIFCEREVYCRPEVIRASVIERGDDVCSSGFNKSQWQGTNSRARALS